MRTHRHILPLLLAAALGACASGGSGGDGASVSTTVDEVAQDVGSYEDATLHRAEGEAPPVVSGMQTMAPPEDPGAALPAPSADTIVAASRVLIALLFQLVGGVPVIAVGRGMPCGQYTSGRLVQT